jgi:hypothetical protein
MRTPRTPIRSNLHPRHADVMHHGDRFRVPRDPRTFMYLSEVPGMPTHWLVHDGTHLTTLDTTQYSSTG